MSREASFWRWSCMGILATAMLAFWPGVTSPSDAQTQTDIKVLPDKPPDALQPDDKTDPASGTADQPKEDKPDDKPEKKDPTDIRNTIGNLSLIRGLDALKKPKPPGLWQQMVEQPYLPAPEKARRLLFFGQYPEAEVEYGKLLKAEPTNQAYVEDYAEAILRQGHAADWRRFEEKVASFTDAQRSTTKMVRLRAEELLARGKRAEARELLGGFIETHPKLDPSDPELLAIYNTYAGILEDAAEYAAAIGTYAKVEALAVGGYPDDSQAATQICSAIYHKSMLSATGRDKFPAVMAELGAIESRDQFYWPAMLLEAQLLLGAHNEKDGGKAVSELLSLNPNNLEARFLGVDNAIEGYNFDAARQQIDEIRQRSDSALADAYEGRVLLKEMLPREAIAPLLEAVKKDPGLPEARGWLAGAYYLLMDKTKLDEQLHAIKIAGAAQAMHPVVVFQAGEVLRDARQFKEAEKLYMSARDEAKWWSEPLAALAQLYLETGQEKEAQDAYDKSWQIDPTNRRALNQLKLLEIIDQFATKDSKSRLRPGSNEPAFTIRYDTQDEVLANLAVQWLEKVRPEILSYYQVTDLPETTQIELFPTHEEFGVRTTGLPWIGTVGACTGNVIAMDVPRGGARDTMGAFDWARVLRHEFTHTVTLAMTNNRIPHWLTEACACEQEQAPRDWENCQLLASNYRAGELFKIANLNWGFIKPKRTADRQLAYMESQWIYEYLVATYGLPKMLDFLHAFHDGLTEPQAWQKVYGKTMDEMDKEFLAWAKTQIESWGLPTDPLPKKPELEEAIKKNPKDVEALVKLAFVEASGGNAKDARKHLQDALAVDPKNLRGRELLGAVLAQGNDKDKAREMLEAVVNDDAKRPVAVRTLGVLAMQRAQSDSGDKRAADFADAEKWFLQLQLLRPLDDASYTNLAGIYLVNKQYPKAIAQLLELQRHEQHDERIPRKLAELFEQQGQMAQAEDSAYRAIRINPYNAINHELMAQVLMSEKEPARAIEFWADATQLQPKVAEFWAGLADARGLTGDKPGANAAAQKALALEPGNAAAKWIQP